jgi:hypothetical protein
MNIQTLHQYAEGNAIDVDYQPMLLATCLALALPEGGCAIALDPAKLLGPADEAMKLAHELGHCATASFYDHGAQPPERCRQEAHANRWMIDHLLPYDDLTAAIRQGHRAPWDLAEYFTLPEDLVQLAIDYYTGPCGLSLPQPDDDWA